jgi:PhzF family phenazine biosynthesis protein
MVHRFQMLDVFGNRPFSGNPLAVVFDAEDLSTDQMQEITRWINLSETAFLLPPTSDEAHYRVRIFTLDRELPFAGHPTLGSCRAWLDSSGLAEGEEVIVQECGVGLVPVRRVDGGLAFSAPPLLRSGSVDDEALVSEVALVLGIEPGGMVDTQWVDNGPGWVAVLLRDAAAVLDLQPDFARSTRDDSRDIGVVGFHPEGSECVYEVRAFFADDLGHTREDPVTGSLNASVAQWLLATGRVTAPYVVSQGTALGRSGRVRIELDDSGTVWVGGSAVTMVEGEIDL